MIPRITLRKALADPQLLGGTLGGESWQAWRVLLIAAMGEALTEEEREIFSRLTGREREPGQRVEELVCVVGRRGGKYFCKLKVLPVDLPTRPWPVNIVTLKNRTLSPVVERFIECAREVTRPMREARPRRKRQIVRTSAVT
jgi:hypothetical protein